jgi:outer membrane protein assembly factor BamE
VQRACHAATALPSIKKLIASLTLLLVAACSWVPRIPGITPYKLDIQQGNVVTQDMVAKLKPGMTKSQVRFALGTPLVVDPFHNDRWDYVYVQQRGGRVTEERRIVVLFSDDKLLRIDGDVLPAGPKPTAEVQSLAPAARADTAAPAPKADSSAAPATSESEPPAAQTTPLR